VIRGRIEILDWRPWLGRPEIERFRLYFDADATRNERALYLEYMEKRP